MIQQAAAVKRIRLPVGDIRFSREGRCVVREGLRGAQVASRRGEADGVSKQVLDLVEFFLIVGKSGGQHGQRLRQRTGLLKVQAAGERERADDPVSDPGRVRDGGLEVAARRGDLAAVEADHGGDAVITAGRTGLLQVVMHDPHLGHRIVPPPCVEEQLAQGAVRLSQPDHRANPVREVPGLPGCGEGLLVPVEAAQRDGLVDLQQQPQVGQCRIGLGHGQRPVEQRQRVSRLPLHCGHDGQHVQCPAHRPVVTSLRCRIERGRGDPAGGLDLAEDAVHPRGEHE